MYRHGIYVSEQETSMIAPLNGTAGLQVVIGTAPVHLLADPAAAINKPLLVYSKAEAIAAVGYSDDFASFTLCETISASFAVVNVAPLVLINVLDPAKHSAEMEEKTVQINSGMAVVEETGVLLSTLVVKNGEETLTAEEDYTAVYNADGTVSIVLIEGGKANGATNLTVSGKKVDASKVTAADIVGGVDASTGKETGLELIRQIYPTLGMVPGLILAPGWSHTPTVAAALQAKTENINGNFNCSCLLDISADSDGAVVYTSVKGAKEALGASSAHAAALWPMVAVGEKKYYFSAMFAALTAYTDANNADVPYESPSNKDLRITATVLKDGTTVALDQQQANDVLNANGVITAINANGFKSWGNNTAAYPSTTDPKDRWWAVRRFFDWDGNNFIQTYFQKVDKPGNKRLIQSIVDSQNIIGNGYVARDYCAGYRVEFRSDENPVTNLLAGHLTVHTYLAPYIPAEYIENIREYDVDALESAIGGE